MKILLVTLHAKYVHASLALPYLAAACRGIDGVTMHIREFTVNEPADRVLGAIVAEEAELVAFSCYIWNIEATLRLISDLKKVSPLTFVALGGPEASYGFFRLLERNQGVDCVIRGEGEETFREMVTTLHRSGAASHHPDHASPLLEVAGLACRAGDEIVATPERAAIAELDSVPSPFAAGAVDLAKPLVYYETSRGCPFSCAFCMSSLEKGVRSFSPGRIEADLELLMAQGVQTVKLVDRTFNFDAARANRIWRFILEHNRTSRFHFEIAADLLTEENLRLLAGVPAGMFRFEIGVQSGEEETLARVGRRSDLARLFANVRRLVAGTGVTVHLDLVAGLPGEDFAGFLRSLQQLFDVLSVDNSYFFGCQDGKEEATEALTRPLAPLSPWEREKSALALRERDRERGEVRRGASDAANAGRREKTDCHIQVEPLKVLKGSPMRRIAREEGYLYSDTPPYKILRTPWLSFAEISRIETIARLLDLYYNSGRFATTLGVLTETVPLARLFSELASFQERRDEERGGSLALLFDELWEFLAGYAVGNDRERMRSVLCYDYCLADYPAGKLPGFFPGGTGKADRGGGKEKIAGLARRLGIGRESRVRTFGLHVTRDPRRPPGEEGGASLLFVYVSTPGRGLEVRVLDGDPS